MTVDDDASEKDWLSPYDMAIGSIVAITGRVWLKTAPDTWESNGRTNITRDGWIERLFSDGHATVLRYGKTETGPCGCVVRRARAEGRVVMNDDYLQARGVTHLTEPAEDIIRRGRGG